MSFGISLEQNKPYYLLFLQLCMLEATIIDLSLKKYVKVMALRNFGLRNRDLLNAHFVITKLKPFWVSPEPNYFQKNIVSLSLLASNDRLTKFF